MIKTVISFTFMMVLLYSCNTNQGTFVSSPDNKLSVEVINTPNNKIAYTVNYNSKTVIDTSFIGFEFKNMPPLSENLKIKNTSVSLFSETWEMPWGEKRFVDNTHNQILVLIEETIEPKRSFSLVFRVFNDGIGFRYIFPQQAGMTETIIMGEHTEFNLTGNPMCWWIPADWDIYEHLYNETRFTEIDALAKRHDNSLAQTHIPYNAVNTPVTLKTDDGIYLSFHEADLTDYADMTLLVDKENLKFVSELVGSDRLGYKVKRTTPFETPWRTIHVTDRAGDLIESDLIVNLNEPNVLGDVSWFKPMKYLGIWWEMHVGKSTWDYSGTQHASASGTEKVSTHGATTENAKAFIDFAAQNNIGGLLVEGWNTGWEHWFGSHDREGVFDFVTPYPDYDIYEVVRYGKEKGVDIIMHHETSAAPLTYESKMDTAFKLMQSLGMNTVKTGYVGTIIPEGEYHHGQWMVNHYHKVLETAAKYNIAINAHEPIKATGKRRTYPNAISREGLRGQEFNAWASDGGNPPEHLSTIAFTRMLAGPIDYTPGIFNIKLDPYKPDNQVNTTLAHQLALYVVIYSPVQMVADLIENYEGHEALNFIREVGVDWEQTRVLDGEIADFVVIAREERETGNWFVGGISDENERSVTVTFDFLPKGETFNAAIYKDAEDAHWDLNPTAYKVEKTSFKNGDSVTINMVPGGGFAISLLK